MGLHIKEVANKQRLWSVPGSKGVTYRVSWKTQLSTARDVARALRCSGENAEVFHGWAPRAHAQEQDAVAEQQRLFSTL